MYGSVNAQFLLVGAGNAVIAQFAMLVPKTRTYRNVVQIMTPKHQIVRPLCTPLEGLRIANLHVRLYVCIWNVCMNGIHVLHERMERKEYNNNLAQTTNRQQRA